MKIEVEIWEMREGKNRVLKDDNGMLFYATGYRPRGEYKKRKIRKLDKPHKHPDNPKPQYYHIVKALTEKYEMLTLESIKSLHPEIPDKKLVKIISLLIKEKVIMQLEKDKFKVL